MAIFNSNKKEMINKAKTYLYAIYSKKCVNGFIRRYGTDILFHQSVLDEDDHRIYGYPIAENLILSHYHMSDVADEATDNIQDLLLSSVETQRTAGELRPVHLYTWLASGADSRPVTPAGTLRWTDKRNNQPTYDEYQQLISTVTRQLRENRSLAHTTFLANDIENPWHSKSDRLQSTTVRDIYSHAHTHGLIATTNPNEARTLQRILRNDFIKVTGYRPSHCNVSSLTWTDKDHHSHSCVITGERWDDAYAMDSIDKFIHYIYRDYHIQTKDCDDFSKLPKQVRHVIIMAQLNSTKQKRIQRYVSEHKADIAEATFSFITTMLKMTAYILSHKTDLKSLERTECMIDYHNILAKIVSEYERITTYNDDWWGIQISLPELIKMENIAYETVAHFTNAPSARNVIAEFIVSNTNKRPSVLQVNVPKITNNTFRWSRGYQSVHKHSPTQIHKSRFYSYHRVNGGKEIASSDSLFRVSEARGVARKMPSQQLKHQMTHSFKYVCNHSPPLSIKEIYKSKSQSKPKKGTQSAIITGWVPFCYSNKHRSST